MNIPRTEINFWRRQSRQKGKALLNCRITMGGERIDIGSTGLKIWWDYWDGEKVTDQDPEAFFKNEHLDIMRNHLRAIFNDLFRKREKITAAKVKRLYENGTVNVTLLAVFALYLRDSEKDPERNLRASSIEVYDNVRKKLTTFLIEQKALDLLVEDFDLSWLNKYRHWMKQVPLDVGQIGHANSYIVKQAHTIKNVLAWAVLNKLADHNPLTGLRIKNAVFDDPLFLSEDEFERLRNHNFENKYLQQTSDIFIILCRCGFHYGDLEDFIKKYRTALRKGVDGELWMMKNRIKTEVAIRVPVFDEVAEIVAKYGGWEKLPINSLSKFNTWLKVVAATLNLPEGLSSKAGRKTFTDWCFNSLMLSTDAVKVLLGRKSDKGLEVYGRPDERRVASELSQSHLLTERKNTNRLSHPPSLPMGDTQNEVRQFVP